MPPLHPETVSSIQVSTGDWIQREYDSSGHLLMVFVMLGNTTSRIPYKMSHCFYFSCESARIVFVCVQQNWLRCFSLFCIFTDDFALNNLCSSLFSDLPTRTNVRLHRIVVSIFNTLCHKPLKYESRKWVLLCVCVKRSYSRLFVLNWRLPCVVNKATLKTSFCFTLSLYFTPESALNEGTLV